MFTSSGGDRRDIVNIGVVITDGRSNDRDETLREAVAARKQGINLIAVGVGPTVGEQELLAMASDPDTQNYVHVNDFNALTGVLNDLLESTCNS